MGAAIIRITETAFECPPEAVRLALHDEDYLACVAYLRDARKAQNLTQRVLAERLGKPHSFIAKYEIADRRLDVAEFIRVLRAMGVEPVEAFKALGWV